MLVNIEHAEKCIKKGICYIVGAVRIENSGWFKRQLRVTPEDYVIAADGGFATCDLNGIPMDLVLGDFDSLGYVPGHPNTIRLQPEKDDTDMLAAVKMGLELGYRAFEIYGGLGGRPDHSMANYQTLVYLASKGACGILRTPDWQLTAIKDDSLRLPAYEHGTLSLFCMGECAEGVTLRGLKYPLTDAEVRNDFPIGVSNEFTGEPVTITVEKGVLLVMWAAT